MSDNQYTGQGHVEDSGDMNRRLQIFDDFIVRQVADLMTGRNGFVHPAVLDLEIDEVVQRVRIKLWRILKERTILHQKAYIKYIVRSEFYDMMRRRRRQFYPLPMDGEEEGYRGHVLVSFGEGMTDPSEEFERQADLLDLLEEIIPSVLKLPCRQRQAMLCELLQEANDPDPLIQVCKQHQLDVQCLTWPIDRSEARLLKASLSAARKNMQKLLKQQRTSWWSTQWVQ